MTRQGDIVAEIKAIVSPDRFDLSRAEGRADFDDALRAQIDRLSGDDKILRRHAGEMIAEWRRGLLWPKPP